MKENDEVLHRDLDVTKDMVDLSKARLDIVVPKGSATPEQLAQILRAQEYARTKGIEIRIIESE